MAEVVLDASAVLAVLLNERGAEAVAPHLAGGEMSAANYAEVLERAAALCGSLADAKHRVDRHGVRVVPLDADQATVAASLAPAGKPLGLSLADRACLALAIVRGRPVLTADGAWARLDAGVRVELIR